VLKRSIFGDFPDAEIPNSRKAIAFLEGFYVKLKPTTILTHSVNAPDFLELIASFGN
jgi:hypothetical protein